MKRTFLWVPVIYFSSTSASQEHFASRGCKAIPGSPSWPTRATWDQLNQTIGGRLLATVPPAAVCHPEQPAYNPAQCAFVSEAWSSDSFHQGDPVSNFWQQYNNNTCIPDPSAPCSPAGYPAYVVNATTAEHVKLGLNFARQHHVRINVKSTGHDYQGRSQAPGSLSIWVHHMQRIQVHASSFQPEGCHSIIRVSSVTVGGGTQMDAIVAELDKLNRTVVAGTSKTVSVGGYISGGGHSVLSPRYGMAADNVLEMEVVTPQGQIVTANSCQNQDLFWAMRGGGGSTFGVMTSVTVKTYPSPNIMSINLAIGSLDLTAPWIWDMVGYIASQIPYLDFKGVSGYAVFAKGYPVSIGSNSTVQIAGMAGKFLILDSQDPQDMQMIWDPIIAHINATWPSATILLSSAAYPSFKSWFDVHYDKDPSGCDMWLASHLLDASALTSNITAVGQAFEALSGQVFLVIGNGTRNAKPEGGNTSVNPSWIRASIHAATMQAFPFNNATANMHTLSRVNAMAEPLRQLAPDMGSYVNEVCAPPGLDAYVWPVALTLRKNNPAQPNWQRSFWGENYDRLLQIKRKVDPNDIMWCHPCVGNERWKLQGYDLCPIS